MAYRVVLDDEVVAAVRKAAEPLVDSVNSVIRRKLGLPSGSQEPIFFEIEPVGSMNGQALAETIERAVGPTPRQSGRRRQAGRQSRGKSSKRTRAPKGSILDERAYWEPILRVLADAPEGSAAAREVVNRVGEMIADQLKPLDLEHVESGGLRWENRVQFARLRMKEQGLLEDAPRGIWKISTAGRRALERGQVGAVK